MGGSITPFLVITCKFRTKAYSANVKNRGSADNSQDRVSSRVFCISVSSPVLPDLSGLVRFALASGAEFDDACSVKGSRKSRWKDPLR